MAVDYEWSFEITDEAEDIIDANHADRLTRVTADDITDSHPGRHLCLVRTRTGDWPSDYQRSWAYAERFSPDLQFDDGQSVPKRYLKEYRRARLAGGLDTDERNER